jgi:hypothetical protein
VKSTTLVNACGDFGPSGFRFAGTLGRDDIGSKINAIGGARTGTTNDAEMSVSSLRHLEVDLSQTEQETRFQFEQAEQSKSCGSAILSRIEPRLTRLTQLGDSI